MRDEEEKRRRYDKRDEERKREKDTLKKRLLRVSTSEALISHGSKVRLMEARDADP